MQIKQVLNNNVVMADDPVKGTVIVVGTGIGFHKRKGEPIEDSRIQQVYVCGQSKRVVELLNQISPEAFEVTEKIATYAKDRCRVDISDEVFFLMVDHISFAVKRLKEGMELDNPFLLEIQRFFPEEYEVGEYARECILEQYNIRIPDEEIGYICMHLINSEYHQEKKNVSKVFQILDLSTEYLREHYLGGVSEDSLSYSRMITHLKFFAKRYTENNENTANDELMNDTIATAFQEESECVNGLAEELEKKFSTPVTQSEKNYLILHLRNCRDLYGN